MRAGGKKRGPEGLITEQRSGGGGEHRRGKKTRTRGEVLGGLHSHTQKGQDQKCYLFIPNAASGIAAVPRRERGGHMEKKG